MVRSELTPRSACPVLLSPSCVLAIPSSPSSCLLSCFSPFLLFPHPLSSPTLTLLMLLPFLLSFLSPPLLFLTLCPSPNSTPSSLGVEVSPGLSDDPRTREAKPPAPTRRMLRLGLEPLARRILFLTGLVYGISLPLGPPTYDVTWKV